MLTVVYHLTGAGMLVGGGPATEIGTALKQAYAETTAGERTSAGQARQTASDNRHSGSLFPSLSHLGQALEKALSQDHELLARRQADFLVENIEASERDPFEQSTVDRHQHPERRLAVFVNQGQQLVGGTIEFPRPLRLPGQQRSDAFQILSRAQLRGCDVEARQFPGDRSEER